MAFIRVKVKDPLGEQYMDLNEEYILFSIPGNGGYDGVLCTVVLGPGLSYRILELPHERRNWAVGGK